VGLIRYRKRVQYSEKEEEKRRVRESDSEEQGRREGGLVVLETPSTENSRLSFQ